MTIERTRSGEAPITEPVRLQADVRTGIATRMLIGLIALTLVSAPSIGFAGEKAAETGREGGLGAAAALTSLVYAPLKLVYATGGLVVGAFAWAFTAGDTIVAEKVFTRSVRGTYVVTPDHLTGEKELLFIGRDVEPSSAQGQAVASAADYSGAWVETPEAAEYTSGYTNDATHRNSSGYVPSSQSGSYGSGVSGTTTSYPQPSGYEAADSYNSGVREIGSLPMATTYPVPDAPAVSAAPPSLGSTYDAQAYDSQGYDDLGW